MAAGALGVAVTGIASSGASSSLVGLASGTASVVDATAEAVSTANSVGTDVPRTPNRENRSADGGVAPHVQHHMQSEPYHPILEDEQEDESVLPGDKSVFPGDKSVFPGDKSVFPGDKSVLPGDKSVLPGDKSDSEYNGDN